MKRSVMNSQTLNIVYMISVRCTMPVARLLVHAGSLEEAEAAMYMNSAVHLAFRTGLVTMVAKPRLEKQSSAAGVNNR